MEPIIKKGAYSRSRRTLKCLDLFSGAGGLSVGFALAGGKPIGAVDFDVDSIKTYRKNFPMAKDVQCCPIEQWKPVLKPEDVDVVIGGPPCQGFSLARGFRFIDDPRNQLYKDFVRVVKEMKPSWFVMENVQGITNIGGGVILQQILDDFDRIGYEVSLKVVNMAEYGIPQSRKRAIFVGNNFHASLEWPQKSCEDPKKQKQPSLFGDNRPFASVNEALSDILFPQGNFFSHRANSQMRGPRNRCAHSQPAFTLRVRGDEFALCEEPATSAFIPGDAPSEPIKYREPQNDLQEFFRFDLPPWKKNFEHPRALKRKPKRLKGTRRITIEEQARLQTFPDWFEFTGRTTSIAKQIGNAVPPLFAYQLFMQIISH